MAYPDFTLPFHLYTNTSYMGTGVILVQVQDNWEHVILYDIWTQSPSEKRHSTTKKECLAIIWAVRKLHPYLLCNCFEIFTDDYSLQWLWLAVQGLPTAKLSELLGRVPV